MFVCTFVRTQATKVGARTDEGFESNIELPVLINTTILKAGDCLRTFSYFIEGANTNKRTAPGIKMSQAFKKQQVAV